MFLGSVSAGLVALGLIATATRIGTAFYTFGLILLSTLSFVGFVTFQRVLQSGIEDRGYAERIARLRAYYFDCAPELVPYLASVPPPQRLVIQGLRAGYWQSFRTVAGMVGVVTAVLAGPPTGPPTPPAPRPPPAARGCPAPAAGRRHPGGAGGVPVPSISFSLRRRAKRAGRRLAARPSWTLAADWSASAAADRMSARSLPPLGEATTARQRVGGALPHPGPVGPAADFCCAAGRRARCLSSCLIQARPPPRASDPPVTFGQPRRHPRSPRARLPRALASGGQGRRRQNRPHGA